MRRKQKVLWLSWHHSARSRNMAQSLGIPIAEYYNQRNWFIRHTFSSLWTVKTLLSARPKVVFIQLSFMLLNVVMIYKLLSLSKVTVVVDCHTKALRRKAKGVLNMLFWPLKQLSFKYVDLSIISNEGLSETINTLNPNYLILPDKIPEIETGELLKKQTPYCVYISSLAVDEPYSEIYTVAEILEEQITLYWTGHPPAPHQRPSHLPSNLNFTGYIPFEEYYSLLSNADCILALTTEEDCLQSGAYEALGAQVPMVISDSRALRSYFESAAVYTSHRPQEIAENISYAIANSEQLQKEIVRIRALREQEFDHKISTVKKKISSLLSDDQTVPLT